MEALLPILIQLISGGAGGNLIGKLLPNLSLGTIGNLIAGVLGGGLGGQLLSGLLGADVAPSGGLDLGSIIGSVGSGAAGGGVLMAIIGLIKKLLAAKA
jgi:hypothetical protein